MKQFKIKFNNQEYKVNYITDALEQFKVAERLGQSGIQNFGLDIETLKTCDHPKAGLEPHLSGISLIQLYDGKGTVYIFDVAPLSKPEMNWFEFLKHKNFVAHYGIFEVKHLTHWGYPNLSIGCSMLLSILVDRAEKTDYQPFQSDDDEDDKPHWKGYGLDAIIGRLFDVSIEKKWQLHDWSIRPVDPEALVYAALDSILTYKITEVQFPKVKQYKMLKHYALLKNMQHVISDMELNGMKINELSHAKLILEWEESSRKQSFLCKKFFGDININSTKQLGEWLVKNKPDEVLTWDRTEKKALGFGKNALSSKQHLPEIKALLEYKKTAKLISTYGDSLAAQVNPVTHRIHCSFTLGETRTGRLSSREPNLQNLPRESSMRNIFVPEPGKKLIIADFNQIELRVAGEVSGDPVIRNAYAKGMDLHSIFASHIYSVPVDKVTKEQRQIAKSANFGTIYGMGAAKFVTYTLSATNGAVKLPLEDAKHIIDSLWGLYKVYGKWCKHIRDTAERVGFVRTPLGKMRRLHPDEVYTKAPNTVVQGGAFEVMAVAMVEARRYLGKGMIINSVHDELIVECTEKYTNQVKGHIDKAMVYGMKKVFPKADCNGLADAKICDTWGEK